ncbi:hypothetical protein [Pannonibacter phragmitetus]|uniref:hypothetical protein n=1 Tax=Pannonibacter phragmitetus TaxID=121719 RepID=UPI003D2EA32A
MKQDNAPVQCSRHMNMKSEWTIASPVSAAMKVPAMAAIRFASLSVFNRRIRAIPRHFCTHALSFPSLEGIRVDCLRRRYTITLPA